MNKLTSTQLCLIMVLSRIFVTLMYTPSVSKNFYVSDFIIQVLVGLVLTLITVIPVYILAADQNKMGLLERCSVISPIYSKCVSIILFGCFLYTSIRLLIRFDIFATTVMFPETDFRFFLILIILCALYCVLNGLPVLGRTSEIFFPLIVISILFVLLSTIKHIQFINFSPILYGGFSYAFKEGLFSTGVNVELIFPLLLKDRITGNIKKCIYPYILGIMGFILILMFFQAGVLGDYALTELFPFFSLTSMASVGFLERLDALLTASWVISVFVKAAMLIYCMRICINNIVPKVKYKSSSVFVAIILSVVALLIKENYKVEGFLSDTRPIIIIYLFAVVLIPISLLILEHTKKGAQKSKHFKKNCKDSGNSKNKKIALSMILIIISMTFSGCLRAEPEIKNITVIQAIGIDYDKDNKEYTVSLEIFDIAQASGMGELESGNLTKIVKSNGKTVSSTMNKITLEIGKPLIFSQKRAVIIGKSALEAGLSNILDFFIRDYKTRLSMPIAIADNVTAEEIISANEGDVSFPARELQTLLKSGKVNGYTTEVDVAMLGKQSIKEKELYIPLLNIKKEGNSKYTKLNGFALVKNDKYVGDLTLDEGRGMLFINDDIKGGSFNVKDANAKTVTLSIVKSNTNIKINKAKNNKMNFVVEINCITDVTEIQNVSKQFNEIKDPSIVEKAADNYVEKIVNESLNKCLNEKHVDVFGFGKRVFILHPDFYREYFEKNKGEINSDDVVVKVNVTVRRLGQGNV